MVTLVTWLPSHVKKRARLLVSFLTVANFPSVPYSSTCLRPVGEVIDVRRPVEVSYVYVERDLSMTSIAPGDTLMSVE